MPASIPDDMEQLLRDFLVKQRQEEQKKARDEAQRAGDYQELKRALYENTDATIKAFHSFSKQVNDRLDKHEHDVAGKLDDARGKADSAHALAMGAHARIDQMAARGNRRSSTSDPPKVPLPWDLGVESATGTHVIVPVDAFKTSKHEWSAFLEEKIEEHERFQDADMWRGVKGSASKIVVAVIGSVAAAFIIAQLVASAASPKPSSPPTPAAHP